MFNLKSIFKRSKQEDNGLDQLKQDIVAANDLMKQTDVIILSGDKEKIRALGAKIDQSRKALMMSATKFQHCQGK